MLYTSCCKIKIRSSLIAYFLLVNVPWKFSRRIRVSRSTVSGYVLTDIIPFPNPIYGRIIFRNDWKHKNTAQIVIYKNFRLVPWRDYVNGGEDAKANHQPQGFLVRVAQHIFQPYSTCRDGKIKTERRKINTTLLHTVPYYMICCRPFHRLVQLTRVYAAFESDTRPFYI